MAVTLPRRARAWSPEPRALAVAAFLVYAVLVGGTALGEVVPALRLVNAVLAGGLILVCLLRARSQADRIGSAVGIAILAFVAASLLSQFPRQSFDAVLGALTYAAGFLVARDLFVHDGTRGAALATLRTLSALLAVVIASRWLPLVMEWWAATGWMVTPPLDLSLPSWPWGHRHDLALLLVMLYPSWWIGPRRPARSALAAVVGALTLIVVVVDGSRTLWLAAAVATLVVLAPLVSRRVRWDRRVVGGLAAAAVAVVGIVGVWGAPLVDRLLTFSTLNARSVMWGQLTELWLAHPVAGIGPGSFPWALQLTGYFDTNTYAPRHPDSMLFQLLPEVGILGLIAVGAIAVALGPRILRGGLRAGAWALVVYAIAGLGANPTDFGFLNVVAITWAALVMPLGAPSGIGSAARWPRAAAVAAIGVVGLAYGATVAGAFAYDEARDLVHRGQLDRAGGWLSTAVSLDPSMSLYARQRGTLSLITGDAPAAIADLSRATELNPSGDLAWRTLGLAQIAADDMERAEAALRNAVQRQRSDPTNLLLLAHLQGSSSNPGAADTAAEVVQGWPSVGSAPSPDPTLRALVGSPEAVDRAIARWRAGAPAPVRSGTEELALVVLGDRPDLEDAALRGSRLSRELALLSLAVYSCDPDAERLLRDASDGSRRHQRYWSLVMMQSARDGVLNEEAMRVYQIMTGGTITPALMDHTLNPLWENNASGFSADAWGYRREPIFWPAFEPMLPSPAAGTARWLLDTSPSRPFGC
jgi:O-antigen ligase/tetratricopeptide (TPR) repeat protein